LDQPACWEAVGAEPIAKQCSRLESTDWIHVILLWGPSDWGPGQSPHRYLGKRLDTSRFSPLQHPPSEPAQRPAWRGRNLPEPRNQLAKPGSGKPIIRSPWRTCSVFPVPDYLEEFCPHRDIVPCPGLRPPTMFDHLARSAPNPASEGQWCGTANDLGPENCWRRPLISPCTPPFAFPVEQPDGEGAVQLPRVGNRGKKQVRRWSLPACRPRRAATRPATANWDEVPNTFTAAH